MLKTLTDDTVVAWLDIETTGLDINCDHILEVGVILTQGPDMAELARASWLTRPDGLSPADTLGRLNEVTSRMHTESGLVADYRAAASSVLGYSQADTALRAFLDEYAWDARPLMGGSSISFDRSFLEQHLPASFSRLHYRSIDMTSVSYFTASVIPLPQIPPQGTAHRALGDLEQNICQWRAYRAQLMTMSTHTSVGVCS